MADARNGGEEAGIVTTTPAEREELFATTTPAERLLANRMSYGTIYGSAEEYSADMRAALLENGSLPEFADMEAQMAARSWTDIYGVDAEGAAPDD